MAIPVAETGFDPQAAGDVYSNYVNRVIFDALYSYDYLRGRYKLVPNTAAALPDISADRQDVDDQDQAGHLLRRRSGVQGQEARAHRRGLRVFAGSASLDPAMRSNSLNVFDGRFVGADAVVAKAKTDRQVRLRRCRSKACRALDRYTLRLQAQLPRRRAAVQPHHRRQRRGRARSRRSLRRRQRMDDGESGRHRSVPADASGAAASRSCSKPIPAFAKSATRRAATAPTARWSQRLAGQADADDRTHRDQRHRGSESAPALVRAATSITCSVPPDLVEQRARPRQQAQAAVRCRQAFASSAMRNP